MSKGEREKEEEEGLDKGYFFVSLHVRKPQMHLHQEKRTDHSPKLDRKVKH